MTHNRFAAPRLQAENSGRQAFAMRRSLALIAASTFCLGMAAMPAGAQGPGMPPPPPDLPVGPAPSGAGASHAGAAGTPAPAVAQPSPLQGGNVDTVGGGAAAELPLLIQGTVSSVTARVMTVSVSNGTGSSTRRVDLSGAVYADANGARIDKFTLKKGDLVVIVTEPVDQNATDQAASSPLDAILVEKNAAAKDAK